MTTTQQVHGTVADGYESLLGIIEAAGPDLGQGGIAFSATVDGEVVADLWAGRRTEDDAWESDTVSALFSATKGMTALCAMTLHDRGLLDVDAPVSEYWPDFAANGKAAVTVRQVLNHSCGSIEIPDYAEFMDLTGNGWADLAEIRSRLAAGVPAWKPGTAHGYHGMTYGYLVGAIVELISGKGLGQLFEEEYANPWGLDLWFGIPEHALSRRSLLLDPAPVAPELQPFLDAMLAPARDPEHPAGRAFLAQNGSGVLDHLAALTNVPAITRFGGGFGDGFGTARSLSALYAGLLAGRGPSQASLSTFTTLDEVRTDKVLGVESAFSLGFQGNLVLPTGVRMFGPGLKAFGHGGAGGQVGFADPERGVTVGFVRSHLSLVSTLSKDLVAGVYAVAGE